MTRMSAALNTASKAAVNLASRSRIKNRNWAAYWPRSMSRLRACWVTQAPGGMSGDAGDVHAAAAVLDHNENVEAAQEDRVDVGEVDGEDRVGLRGEELAPGRPGSSRSRIEAGFLEDRPGGGRGDRMAESDQFAVDAAVAPPWVLPGDAQYQRSDRLRDRWSSGLSSSVGPAAGHELGMPSQQCSWRDQPEPV